MQSSRPEEGPDADDRESAYELLQRGQDLLDRRHFAQAAIVLERADRLEPGKGSIIEALGRAYFNSGQTERARSAFAALLEVDPSSPGSGRVRRGRHRTRAPDGRRPRRTGGGPPSRVIDRGDGRGCDTDRR